MSAADWPGAPQDTLGCPVPIQQFVAQTNRAVIALPHAVAFREGCILKLQIAVQRGSLDAAAWDEAIDGSFGPGSGQTGIEADLRFGVRFP